MLPLDIEAGERGYAGQPRATTTPEDVFEHRWAMTVLSQAMRRLEEELRVAGKSSLFDQLQPYLTSGRERPSYRHTAAGLGMSEGAVKVAVHRLRRRFGACLRAVLAETVGDQADVDEELRHLLTILGR